MTAAQAALADRLRRLLADEPVVREVAMFGGRSFVVNGKLAVSALKDGGLLVRVPVDQHDELLGRPGSVQARMGAGRDMGSGWIEVVSSAVADDEGLASWIGIAMAYNRLVTGGA